MPAPDVSAPAVQPSPTPRGPVTPSRDLRLDSLRGLMLVAMAVDHLDTELRVLTDHVFGFVSTAEGFVFLSGLVTGLVYTRSVQTRSSNGPVQRASKRALQIYGCHLLSFGAVFIVLRMITDLLGAVPESAPALFFSRPTEALILGSLSLYQPGLLDILPMYCFSVLLSPIALEILYRWKWITLLGISFAVWIVAQTEVMTYIEHSLQSLAPVNFGSFDILAWQLPFFAGFTFGHLWVERPESSFHFPPSLVLLCFVLTGLGWAFKNDYLSLQQLGISLWDFADKTRLAPLRLLNFITLTYLIAFINTYRPKFFVSRALAFLGQHSLAVFTFQAIFVSVLLTQPVLSSTFAHRTLTALATVGSLFFFACLHELCINWSTHQKPIEPKPR